MLHSYIFKIAILHGKNTFKKNTTKNWTYSEEIWILVGGSHHFDWNLAKLLPDFASLPLFSIYMKADWPVHIFHMVPLAVYGMCMVPLLTYWSSSIRTGEQKHSVQSGHPDQEKKAKSKLQIPRYQNFWVPARAFEIVFRCLLAISKKSIVLKKEKHFSDKPWLLQ